MEFALQVFQFILLSCVLYGRSLDLDVQSMMNVTPRSTQPEFWSQLRVKFECHRGFSSKCCLLSLIIFYFSLPLIGSQKPLYRLNQSDTKQSYLGSFFFFFLSLLGERVENKQVLINKSMPVVTASGLQPGMAVLSLLFTFEKENHFYWFNVLSVKHQWHQVNHLPNLNTEMYQCRK